MNEACGPNSDFLIEVAAGNVPLTGSAFAETNLERLIAMTSATDEVDRDWATFLLANQDLDTAAIRSALLRAAEDDSLIVRAEAISGLAQRDRGLALPLVQKALLARQIAMPILEAAEFLAHPSLVSSLRIWAERPEDAYFDGCVAAALAACETGIPGSGFRDA